MRTPLLITIDPTVIRSWSCCEPPSEDGLFPAGEIADATLSLQSQPSLSEQAHHPLSWLSLVSGEFFRQPQRSTRFNKDNAADRLLLNNLKIVRDALHKGNPTSKRTPLDYNIIHDLLARLMFIQFLADRRDASGKAALDADFLEQRRRDGTLTREYEGFPDILTNKKDTYSLFRWLSDKFNGDLFPSVEDQAAEEEKVGEQHLEFLAAFVRGDVQMELGQGFLWRQYSFDVIPLEFISSIYEEFVRKKEVGHVPSSGHGGMKGLVYTPTHLVDFILDGVLPWDDTNWKVRILDPACGSGIFMVKSYQRLIHRWRLAHPGKRPSAKVLRWILEKCLFGVDTEPGAVRVASFSLYLAMCD